MPSHFSAIGFAADTEEDFMALMERAASEGQALTSRKGEYVLWAPGGGPELWAQVQITGWRRRRSLVGCNPHFRGRARMRFGAIRASPSDVHPMDGAVDGWVDPTDETPDSGIFPTSLDVPDFEVSIAGLTFPRNLELQVAAFAHTLVTYMDEDAFRRGGSKMAAKSFIPVGTFEEEKPSTGFFCGEILGAELKVNPATGARFHHLLVETLGGQVDIVADPNVLVGEPGIGGIAECTAWLSARLA